MNQQKNIDETPKLPSKPTKKDLMEAYAILLKQYKEKVSFLKDNKQKRDENNKAKILENVKNRFNGMENIKDSIDQTKKTVNDWLFDIEDKLNKKFREFVDMEKAVGIQKENLNELYKIENSSDALLALLKAQEDQKYEFNQIKQNQKEQWEQEKNDFKTKIDRELEEYEYEIKCKKRDLLAQFEQDKEKLEKELNERKQALILKENEFAKKEEELQNLRNEKELFSETLRTEKEQLKQRLTEQLSKEHATEIRILRSQSDSEKELLKNTIKNLEAVIEEQKQRIVQLNNQVKDSSKQVQEIVLRSIDSSARKDNLKNIKEIAVKQAEGYRQTDE
jgi:hypothetical protein